MKLGKAVSQDTVPQKTALKVDKEKERGILSMHEPRTCVPDYFECNPSVTVVGSIVGYIYIYILSHCPF